MIGCPGHHLARGGATLGFVISAVSVLFPIDIQLLFFMYIKTTTKTVGTGQLRLHPAPFSDHNVQKLIKSLKIRIFATFSNVYAGGTQRNMAVPEVFGIVLVYTKVA